MLMSTMSTWTSRLKRDYSLLWGAMKRKKAFANLESARH